MKLYILGIAVIVALTGWALSLTIPGLAVEPSPTAPAPLADPPVAARFIGTISALDRVGNSLTVRGATGSQTFSVPPDVVIVMKDKPAAKIGDLKIGDKVGVTFLRTEGDTTFTATRIDVLEA